ncbi:MAG: hydroxymethylbilane synthase, partial [Pseudomonadota bacterium]
LAAMPPRDDPRDAFVTPDGSSLEDLPSGARVGTSSIRRRAQLARLRPDLELVPMRGNVGTRLMKLAKGEADATFLAEAGLQRLDHDDVRRSPMAVDAMLPAPGQGVLCIQTRAGDERALEACALINCPDTALASAAERAIVQSLNASCRTPLAAYATVSDGEVNVRAEILTPDGDRAITGARQLRGLIASDRASSRRAAEIGQDLATYLAEEAGPDLARIFGQQ